MTQKFMYSYNIFFAGWAFLFMVHILRVLSYCVSTNFIQEVRTPSMPSPPISKPEISQIECYFERQKDPGNLPRLNFFLPL